MACKTIGLSFDISELELTDANIQSTRDIASEAFIKATYNKRFDRPIGGAGNRTHNDTILNVRADYHVVPLWQWLLTCDWVKGEMQKRLQNYAKDTIGFMVEKSLKGLRYKREQEDRDQ